MNQPATARLTWRILLGYALPALPVAALSIPLGVLLQNYYGEDLGLGLSAVAIALFIARLCIFVVDPLVGWLSDHVAFPFIRGRRRPWIILGGVFAVVAVWQLLLPASPPPLSRS